MRYVFFDIECASVNKETAKICVFGYVVTDEQFHILEQQDLRLNPKGGFHLTDRKGERGLVLPYEYKSFRTCPTFDKAYPTIKALLEGEDTLVFGHAAVNDVKYLCLETKRFSLPSFTFAFGDTQLLYMTRENSFATQPGLETVTKSLGVDFTPHRAMDDAYATMKVAEALCKEEHTDLFGLLKKYGCTLGVLRDYQYSAPLTEREIAYREECERKRIERLRHREAFFRVVNAKHPFVNGAFKGKIFCFSRKLEEEEEGVSLVQLIYQNGGKYLTRLSSCNVFVCRDETGERFRRISERTDVTVLTPEELRKLV
ncbi:MAG: hypothetical protein J6D37_04080 [Clostridia bacterium]|nr:hypothetical protein [Clostridia bacterium]